MNIFLIIMMVVIPIGLILCNIYIMVYFQHPEETGVNWFWRIIIIVALELCELSILLIPADVMNAGPPDGEIPMEIIWYVIYYLATAFVMIILPFILCWFNQDQDEKIGKKIGLSLFFTAAFLIVIAVFSVLFYIIFGVAQIPMKTDSAQMQLTELQFEIDFNETVYEPEYLMQTKVETDKTTTTIEFRISIILFLIAGVSTIGFALVVIFGGMGFGILPIDLIFSFINRPKPIKDADKKKYTKIIGEKALKMLDEAKQMKTMSKMKYRKKFTKFREDVYILDRALRTLNKRADMKGFIWGYVSLILGILSAICTIIWCVQLVLSMFHVPYAMFDFVMSWFTGPLVFVGIIFYALFAAYLFCAAFKAVRYIGFRFGIGFLFFPFEVGNTYMNAFAFNCMLLIFIGFGTNTLCSDAFATFTSGTSIELFMGNSITELRYVKYLYTYAPIIMPILAVAFAVFVILSKVLCKHQKEKDDLEILLEKEHVKEDD